MHGSDVAFDDRPVLKIESLDVLHQLGRVEGRAHREVRGIRGIAAAVGKYQRHP